MILRTAKRVVIFVVGTTVVLLGIAMTVLPGPAVLVIPAGLAILATEFVWARRLLNKMKATAVGARDRLRGFPVSSRPPGSEGTGKKSPACGEQSAP